jgi:hypothetical protein
MFMRVNSRCPFNVIFSRSASGAAGGALLTFGIRLAVTSPASIATPAAAQNVRIMPPLDPANRELTTLL